MVGSWHCRRGVCGLWLDGLCNHPSTYARVFYVKDLVFKILRSPLLWWIDRFAILQRYSAVFTLQAQDLVQYYRQFWLSIERLALQTFSATSNHSRRTHRGLEKQKSIAMSQPSFQASNAIIYLTYGAFLYESLNLLLVTLDSLSC